MVPLYVVVGGALLVGVVIGAIICQKNTHIENHQHNNDSRTKSNRNHKNNTDFRANNKSSTRRRKKTFKDYENGKCPVCFDKVQSNHSSMVLKCGHRYHRDCLSDLIRNDHQRCSQCREDIEIMNFSSDEEY